MSETVLSPRVKSLLKPSYHILDDPWLDNFPSLNSFLSRGRNLDRGLKSFYFFMKVNEFKHFEVDVKLEDGFVVVRAKQEEMPGNFVGQEFKRQYKLPEDISPAFLQFTFEKGLLKVKVNKVLSNEDGGEAILPNLERLNLTGDKETMLI